MHYQFTFSWSTRPEEIEIVDVCGIDPQDHPRYCDAYIESARAVATGHWCNDEELGEMTANGAFMYQVLKDWLS
jgi:hypothetical protein